MKGYMQSKCESIRKKGT